MRGRAVGIEADAYLLGAGAAFLAFGVANAAFRNPGRTLLFMTLALAAFALSLLA